MLNAYLTTVGYTSVLSTTRQTHAAAIPNFDVIAKPFINWPFKSESEKKEIHSYETDSFSNGKGNRSRFD